MIKHKWHKEIKAWADGAEIENRFGNTWVECKAPHWGEQTEYRIKPQPKEPEYLYVWKDSLHHITFTTNPPHPAQNTWDMKLIGKIKLEPYDG